MARPSLDFDLHWLRSLTLKPRCLQRRACHLSWNFNKENGPPFPGSGSFRAICPLHFTENRPPPGPEALPHNLQLRSWLFFMPLPLSEHRQRSRAAVHDVGGKLLWMAPAQDLSDSVSADSKSPTGDQLWWESWSSKLQQAHYQEVRAQLQLWECGPEWQSRWSFIRSPASWVIPLQSSPCGLKT